MPCGPWWCGWPGAPALRPRLAARVHQPGVGALSPAPVFAGAIGPGSLADDAEIAGCCGAGRPDHGGGPANSHALRAAALLGLAGAERNAPSDVSTIARELGVTFEEQHATDRCHGKPHF